MTQVIDEVGVRDLRDARESPRGEVEFDAPSGMQGGAWSEGRRAAVFDQERARLLALAMRVLGGRAEAEDVVQDAWFRWREADAEAVRVPQAWLATATVRLAIDRLRKQRRERSGEREAPGAAPWLDDVAAFGGGSGPARRASRGWAADAAGTARAA
ncbi:sigma factor [Paraburkholderia sacchari]|uniref:sigma factor n=1 Tax=Paraburkholderia sacchari TaxID=159450 RepID=UPI003D96E817